MFIERPKEKEECRKQRKRMSVSFASIFLKKRT
jgi:hypothetical protein